jgi:hypothetical protein
MIFSRTPSVQFTGNCPVRQHTADGAFVGRCWHSTYDGYCPSHGKVSKWLGEDADLANADDRKIDYAQRDFGPRQVREKLFSKNDPRRR